jgi:CHASE3 domain sensor protein
MNQNWTIEGVVKIFTPLLTLVTVLVGIYQFNAGQKENRRRELIQTDRDILAKFKENQNRVYTEAMGVISYLITDTSYTSPEYQKNLQRFNQLYWVQLSFVENKDVENQMDTLYNSLQNLKMLGYHTRLPEFVEINESLPDKALAVSIAMKRSSMDYSLPEGLKIAGQ